MISKQSNKEIPTTLFRIIMIVLLLIGVTTTVFGIHRIENYNEPYIFGIIFGGMGLVTGVLIALKIKPYTSERNDYFTSFLSIILFFFGIFLFSGSKVNEKLSVTGKNEQYVVTDKFRQKSGYRTPEINSLVVDINGSRNSLVCGYSF